MESNCFLSYRFDLVHGAYLHAKIILPVRTPLDWLESIFNNNLRFRAERSETVEKYHQVLFDPGNFLFSKHDNCLASMNLYPLSAYLGYWVRANISILRCVMNDQLYILNTDHISTNLGSIAEFLNIPQNTLDVRGRHLNKTQKITRFLVCWTLIT